jgi:hypothetical protein
MLKPGGHSSAANQSDKAATSLGIGPNTFSGSGDVGSNPTQTLDAIRQFFGL